MNDRIQTYIHENFIAVMFVVLCIAIGGGYLLCLRTVKPATSDNVTTAVQQVKQDASQAGTSVKQASVENESARNSVERASATVGEMRERIDRSQAEIREAGNLVGECQQLNREAQGILEGVGATNK